MTDHNEAMRLADEEASGAWIVGTKQWCAEAAALIRQQAERISELGSAHAIAIEIGAQYAAERDQLRAEVESLRSAVNAFCDATSWSAQSWKDQPFIKPLFDLAGITHKDEG